MPAETCCCSSFNIRQSWLQLQRLDKEEEQPKGLVKNAMGLHQDNSNGLANSTDADGDRGGDRRRDAVRSTLACYFSTQPSRLDLSAIDACYDVHTNPHDFVVNSRRALMHEARAIREQRPADVGQMSPCPRAGSVRKKKRILSFDVKISKL